jgi:hypothetical protein
MNGLNILHDVRLSLTVVARVVVTVYISVIFTLYLSPTYYVTADLLAALLLVVTIGVFGLCRSGIMTAFKPLGWLLTMLLYVVVFGLSRPELDMAPYLRGLLIGFLPYLLLYLLFRNQERANIPLLVVCVFLIPGLIHLAFMYLDIFRAIQQGDVPFLSSSRHGFLEYIKDTPRVGRRYLSLALLHLLFAGLMMSWYLRRTPTRYLAWGLSSFTVLSLVLLDARAAYVSVLIGGGLLAMAVGPSRVWQSLKLLMPTGFGGRCLLVSLLVASAGLGFSAGKSRWVSMNESFSAAVHDVFDSEVELTQRPFVNANYWSAPIEDIDECYLEGHFRCRIDQSAYLRMAWLISGLQGLVEQPVGIGYSEDYMARLWGVAGEQGKYQRIDSFLIELIVSFGVVGIMFYAWLVWGLLHSLRQTVRSGDLSIVLIATCGLICICLGRALVDPLDEGFRRYLMALIGMYYGLLYSNEQHIRG